MSDIILSCENLSVGYEKKVVAGGISFTLHAGEIMAVIGANGAGKSTLLRTVAGLLEAVSGTVSIDGERIEQINKGVLAKKLAILLTDKIESEYMTCEEIVATGRYAYTGALGILTEEDKVAIEEAMATIDILPLRDSLFSKLSDGQRQRVMLARAISANPKIIILDEPTSFLDIGYKIEIMKALKDLAREKGIAVLMSMHDIELVGKIADTVMSIKDGKVDRIGGVTDILTEEYVSQLFGVDIHKYREYYG